MVERERSVAIALNMILRPSRCRDAQMDGAAGQTLASNGIHQPPLYARRLSRRDT